MCESLLKNEIDLAICFGGEVPYSIVQTPLYEKELVAIVPSSYAKDLDQFGQISFSELLNLGIPLIGLDERDPLGMQLSRQVHSFEPDYHYLATVRSHSVAADLAIHQSGIAIVDPWTASQYRHFDEVEFLQFTPNINITVSLLYAEHYPLSIVAKDFIDQLEKLYLNNLKMHVSAK